MVRRLAAGGRRIRTCGPTFREDSGSELAIRFPERRRHWLRAVLISENDDFEFPAAKVTSLTKARASC